MKNHIHFILIMLSIALLPSCVPQSSADYRLVEHIEDVKLPVDSDMELLSSLEHHREPKSQSKRNEHSRRRLRGFLRTICAKEFTTLAEQSTKNPFTETESKQPGLLRLGVIVGNSSIHVYDAFR